jgi:hypothetical protein
MPFDENHYANLRPFLYHLTARANLASIREDRRLRSAATLLSAANLHSQIRVRREGLNTIDIGGREVVLRDQIPLRAGAIAFTGKYGFADFVELLNGRVFFWAGDEQGPAGRAKGYGRRHFETYKDERPAILRIGYKSLLEVNPGQTPLLCEFNSGATRCSSAYKTSGCKVPRGPDTFRSRTQFPRGAADVAEVTFMDHVVLPADVKLASQFDGTWRSL